VAELTLPFEGLPTVWVVLFTVALIVIVGMVVWTAILFWHAQQARRNPPEASIEGCEEYTWVFLVPALNEEMTIRDSVRRLLEIAVDRRRIVVIDDASDDRTPEILREIAHPDMHVLRREPPNARQGKAGALNHAYRALDRVLGGGDRRSVIVVVVDADGRLHPFAPSYAAAHFSDPEVGGVQSLVRIYNRGQVLTWMQDIEFSVYGCLYQAGRNTWNTAGMGGNGQFNRLVALDDVADGDGPWRDRLTEDQDLGLRLIAAGWHGRQDLRAIVEQQGLPGLRRLYRQRARWSQGNLQAIGLIDALRHAPVSFTARVEQIAYLLMPLWQGIVGIALVAAIGLTLSGVGFWHGGSWWQFLFFYLLGFGGTMLGCIASGLRKGTAGAVAGFLFAQVYAFYSWLLWPALLRAAFRQLTHRRGWAKTQREPLSAGPPPA
jgi:cellulose synthase/poly-beta-1,6-N-acetylglucosamine synthase-like glycosyltransferase